MAEGQKKAKKRNFTEDEVETRGSEVEEEKEEQGTFYYSVFWE